MSIFKRVRAIAAPLSFGLILTLVSEIILPLTSFATGGPSDLSGFVPSGTSDMVNPFTGEFSYNIPVLEVPGPEGSSYPIKLNYQGGNDGELIPSWVGKNFSLSTGYINQVVRGIPDSYKGDPITTYNRTRPNWTASVKRTINAELFSYDKFDVAKSVGTFGVGSTLRFNNHMGFQRFYGFNAEYKGMVGLGVNASAQGVTFSPQINIMRILSKYAKSAQKTTQQTNTEPTVIRTQREQLQERSKLSNRVKGGLSGGVNAVFGSTYAINSFSEVAFPSYFSEYEGYAYNYSLAASFTPSGFPIGVQLGQLGNLNVSWNKSGLSKAAYGYMNTPLKGYENTMSDYHVERNETFNKRDLYLGIPYANADQFIVSGEGLNGAFRYVPDQSIAFKAPEGKSVMPIAQAGLELDIGLNLGIGLDFGLGYQNHASKGWNASVENGAVETYSGGSFRFVQDPGGSVTNGANDKVASASLDVLSNMIGAKAAGYDDSESMASNNTNTGNSSYIEKLGTGTTISGFSIYNEDGKNYVYGKSAMVRNESDLTFAVPQDKKPADNNLAYLPTSLKSNYNIDETKHTSVIGTVKPIPYANTFLLTEIRSADFVQRDASESNLSGNYGHTTKFDYFKAYGTNNDNNNSNWYRYRTPYIGLHYQPGQISDYQDDQGSVQTGEKEVHYLKTVETSTHVACFVTNKSIPSRFPSGYNASFITGSGTDRKDGLSAAALTADNDPGSTGAKGSSGLEYLEKIVLFAKNQPDKPVKVVHFKYDYSLVNNIPNNIDAEYPADARFESGMLTLKKMWTELDGTAPIKISPYEFFYQYKDKTTYAEAVVNKYGDLLNLNTRYSDGSQNPSYAPNMLDAWGNIQWFGAERTKFQIPWPYQGKIPATLSTNTSQGSSWRSLLPPQQSELNYDPAAWQLKVIKMPGNAELHITYESHEYAYVQDRSPLAMVSLLGFEDSKELVPGVKKFDTQPTYYLNLSDLGINQNDLDFNAQRDTLIGKINQYYGEDREKMYFKFLYNISFQRDQSKAGMPTLNDCESEYISGYAKFKECVADTYKEQKCIKIVLAGENSANGEYTTVPRQACYDFASTSRIGKNESSGCRSSYEATYDSQIQEAVDEPSKLKSAFGKFVLTASIITEMGNGLGEKNLYGIPHKMSLCTNMNSALSYLRIPMHKPKRGGGVRVKRILTYDKGLEEQDAVLYGSEYSYVTEDGKCSGVATNEPSAMREENPLVTFLPRKDQSTFSRLTAGEDMEQGEGPIGESLLPSASIGYSRIVAKNIHTGKSSTGFTVHEHYTAKDYPIDRAYPTGKGVDYTALSDNDLNDFMILPLGLVTYERNKAWRTQGYRFILNQMHGQQKRLSSWGGSTNNFNKAYLVSSKSMEYYEPGETVTTLNFDDSKNPVFTKEIPGREIEVCSEEKALYDNALDITLEVDLTIGLDPPPKVFVVLVPAIEIVDKSLATHVTSKIIRYPAILKRTTDYKDGVYAVTENVAFSKQTGMPIIHKKLNSFDGVFIKNKVQDGAIYNTVIPASFYYDGMKQKSQDTSRTNQLNQTAGMITSYGTAGNPLNPNWFDQPKNVISSSVETYTNDWNTSWNDTLIATEYNSQAHLVALNKMYRPQSQYTYKDTVKTEKIYEGGYVNEMPWYFKDPSNNKWIRAQTVSKYIPKGMVAEEKDELEIPSAFKYNKHSLVIMSAHNADYGSLYFNDYETMTTGPGHSGKYSGQVHAGDTLIGNYPISEGSLLTTRGGIFKLWVKEFQHNTVDLNLKVEVNGKKFDTKKIAKTGEWSLYESEIASYVFSKQQMSVKLSFNNPAGGFIYVDDTRLEPKEATATCVVYDPKTLRPLVEFDDRHFGTYYEYNQEGRLIRKMIETEKGIKTVVETQYNVAKSPKSAK